MGNWHISIRGIGPHHNMSRNDANALAADLVERLVRAGQTVIESSFTYGGCDDVSKDPIVVDTTPRPVDGVDK